MCSSSFLLWCYKNEVINQSKNWEEIIRLSISCFTVLFKVQIVIKHKIAVFIFSNTASTILGLRTLHLHNDHYSLWTFFHCLAVKMRFRVVHIQCSEKRSTLKAILFREPGLRKAAYCRTKLRNHKSMKSLSARS